jgi:hypothetical protein
MTLAIPDVASHGCKEGLASLQAPTTQRPMARDGATPQDCGAFCSWLQADPSPQVPDLRAIRAQDGQDGIGAPVRDGSTSSNGGPDGYVRSRSP